MLKTATAKKEPVVLPRLAHAGIRRGDVLIHVEERQISSAVPAAMSPFLRSRRGCGEVVEQRPRLVGQAKLLLQAEATPDTAYESSVVITTAAKTSSRRPAWRAVGRRSPTTVPKGRRRERPK